MILLSLCVKEFGFGLYIRGYHTAPRAHHNGSSRHDFCKIMIIIIIRESARISRKDKIRNNIIKQKKRM